MDRSQLAEEIFLGVADLPAAERLRRLDLECGDDAELRGDVEALLAADAKNGAGIVKALETEAESLLNLEGIIGSRLGPYRITGELGRGGMGAVYLAIRDDDQYSKQVAIKLIRRGMDTEDVLDRFRHERQILANLEHPYIARLLDGGTAPDGRPYLVMEHVQGEPLDEYCRVHDLDARARCALFLKVCEAVSYAHRNLVVHRDLKPGNVLITPEGTPRLLDFGVAKLLDPAAGPGRTVTALAMRPLTPEYASPEQIRAQPVTTAADVYSLGAILYLLLAGQGPHRLNSYHWGEVERVIGEIDPPRMSEAAPRWNKILRGDLDAIAALALRKEPALRYGSVDELAADVERYLKGQEVHAREGDFRYRAGKLLRRHGTAIVAGTMIVAMLAGGATIAAIQAMRASRAAKVAEQERESAVESRARAVASQQDAVRQASEAQRQRTLAETQSHQAELARIGAETQRQLADRRFEQVRQLSGKFLLEFHDAIAKLPGSTPARKMVVETGLQYYDTLVKEAHGNTALLEEVARGYDRLGDVQGNPYYANLGDVAGALASYRKAAAVRQQVNDPSAEFLHDRIQGLTKLGQLLGFQGDQKGGEQALKEAIALGERGPAAQDYAVREALQSAYSNYGDHQVRLGAHSEAVEPYLKLLEVATEQARVGRDPVSEQVGVSLAHTKLGDAYGRLERYREGVEQLRIAIEIDRRLAEADANSIPRTRKLYIDYLMLGRILRTRAAESLASPGEVQKTLETGADLAVKMGAADPNNNLAWMDILTARSNLGDWLRQNHQLDSAIASFRAAVEASEHLNTSGAQVFANDDASAQAHQRLGAALAAAGQSEEALGHLRTAEQYVARSEERQPGLIRNALRRADIAGSAGDAYAGEKKWKEAIGAYRDANSLFEGQRARDPKNDSLLSQQPDLYMKLADCHSALEQSQEAAKAIATAVDRLRELESRRPLDAGEQEQRSQALAKLEQSKAR